MKHKAFAVLTCALLLYACHEPADTDVHAPPPAQPALCFICVHGERVCMRPAICDTDSSCEELTGIPVSESRDHVRF